jgi:predicted RNA-binding Zn ribbon-like protein
VAAVKTPSGFFSEAAALDFLNALDPLEMSSDEESFLRWLEQRGLVPSDTLAEIRANAELGELEAVAAQAKALNEWFRDLVKDFMGKPIPSGAEKRLQPLNRILERDVRVPRIEVRDNLNDRIAGSALKWSTVRVWQSPSMLILPVAEAMAELLCTEDFRNVRVCEGRGCGFLFVDRTGKGTRRWCSMAVCGNRAKQATRRQNQE